MTAKLTKVLGELSGGLCEVIDFALSESLQARRRHPLH